MPALTERISIKLSRPVEQGLQAMLDGYYRAHGYDPATGWPIEKRLKELGLEADGRRLNAAGITLPSADRPPSKKEGHDHESQIGSMRWVPYCELACSFVHLSLLTRSKLP
jgi:hypothetical protein